MFEVKVDLEKKIVYGRMTGYIDLDEYNKFEKEWKNAAQKFNGEDFYVINDMRGYVPASQDVARKMMELTSFMMKHGMKKVAQIIDKSITKLQMRRIMKDMCCKNMVEFFFEHEKDKIDEFLKS